MVQATETATSDILACAERIQEMAWTLREQGVEGEVCDLLDANATEVYTACSFQDLTGQRTRKVIQVLRYLEEPHQRDDRHLGPRRRDGGGGRREARGRWRQGAAQRTGASRGRGSIRPTSTW